MKVLRRIGLVVLGILGLLVLVGFFLPAEYSAERSIVIEAPPEVVFEQVVDLRKNEVWSPWMEADPTIKPSYGEQTVGEGASYTWTSENSGNGKLTIVKVVPGHEIHTDLDFDGQLASATWTFEPAGSGVEVTWTLKGDSGWNILGRYFGAMMDSMVGPDFERGLKNLKSASETAARS